MHFKEHIHLFNSDGYVHRVSSDDVVEAYNLIKDLEPTTPQVTWCNSTAWAWVCFSDSYSYVTYKVIHVPYWLWFSFLDNHLYTLISLQEYILKGVVNAALGQEQGSVSTIKTCCLIKILLLYLETEVFVLLL